jgi:3-oxoacyl-[acyl-carrier protein] reductase
MELSGQVAVVTGGASGIGRAVAQTLADAGAAGVVIADVDADEADEVASAVGANRSTRGLAVPTDVTNEGQVAAMVARTLGAFGRIDILVNNAGICPVVGWEKATVESWKRILDINLTGMYICTRAVVPSMAQRRYGRIVFISSMGGLVGSIVAHVAYGVSKAGVLALMKSVAKEFAGSGILSNAICPGSIDTPLTDSFGESTKADLAKACLLKRQGSAAELADAVLFLVSGRSTYITGTVLNVNGGVFTA